MDNRIIRVSYHHLKTKENIGINIAMSSQLTIFKTKMLLNSGKKEYKKDI